MFEILTIHVKISFRLVSLLLFEDRFLRNVDLVSHKVEYFGFVLFNFDFLDFLLFFLRAATLRSIGRSGHHTSSPLDLAR